MASRLESQPTTARAGLDLGGRDVYLNVAGGLRISEPAADLAVAAAIASSLTGEPMPNETVVFGEIGLSGEVRTVGRADARLKEAAKLGFRRAIVPRRPRKDGGRDRGGDGNGAKETGGLAVTEIADVGRLAAMLAGEGPAYSRTA
mgnify:FL=1